MKTRKLTDSELSALRERYSIRIKGLGILPNVGRAFLEDGRWQEVMPGLRDAPEGADEVEVAYIVKRTKDDKWDHSAGPPACVRLDDYEPLSDGDREHLDNLTATWHTLLRCQECGLEADPDDLDPDDVVYECGSCGEEFTRDDADGTNRCPACSKFGQKMSVGRCQECEGPVMQVREKTKEEAR